MCRSFWVCFSLKEKFDLQKVEIHLKGVLIYLLHFFQRPLKGVSTIKTSIAFLWIYVPFTKKIVLILWILLILFTLSSLWSYSVLRVLMDPDSWPLLWTLICSKSSCISLYGKAFLMDPMLNGCSYGSEGYLIVSYLILLHRTSAISWCSYYIWWNTKLFLKVW